MKRLSILLLVFTITFAFFILAPAFLNQPFAPNPYLKLADVLDLFTPLVIIPLYYLLLYFGASQKPGLSDTIVFLVFNSLWVLGQGMHLSANTIGHWLATTAGDQVYDVTYFYDEELSHYLWHLGAAALSVQLIFRSWKHPFQAQSSHLYIEMIAGMLYGLTIFIIGIEGGTVWLWFPFSAITAIAVFALGWRKFKHLPVMTYFMLGYALAALIFTGWGLFWRGFPQFSHLGWI